VAALPDFLDRGRHVELGGRPFEPWARRVGIALLAAFVLVALANGFGQATSETTARADAAALTLRAPSAVRSGLVYQVLFRIDARRDLEEAALVLDPGWFEGFTINSYQPEPVEWEHRDGRNVLVYGPVSAGGHLVARLQYQVNPTAWGRRTQNVVLEDGGVRLAFVEHTNRIYP
jgi:hypothetical protein